MESRLPSWLRKTISSSKNMHDIKSSLREKKLHTVCEEAKCPNIGECFEKGNATLMIMGNTCTRHCGFCTVSHGKPGPLDPDEPVKVAMQVRELGLKHTVITSVTRDDLADGGAVHFAKCIEEIRKTSPDTTIEVLVPDFEGRIDDIKTVCDAKPDVFNHNVETVARITRYIRNKASYARSMEVLSVAKRLLKGGLTKSGIMVGLGETFEEVEKTLCDLRKTGCDIVTIGQYLKPRRDAIPVAEYIEPKVFRDYENIAKKLDFKAVFSDPLVRSSYLADELMKRCK